MSYAPSLIEIRTIRAFAQCEGNICFAADVLRTTVEITEARIIRLARKADIPPRQRIYNKELATKLFAWFEETERLLAQMAEYRLNKAKEQIAIRPKPIEPVKPTPSEDPMSDPAF